MVYIRYHVSLSVYKPITVVSYTMLRLHTGARPRQRLFVLLVVGFLHVVHANSGHVDSYEFMHASNSINIDRTILDTKETKWKPTDPKLWTYQNNSDLTAHLKGLEKRCKKFMKIEKIGQSMSDQDILAIHMSKYVGEGYEGLPKVKIVGNLHGDEPTGRVFTIALAEWLCDMKDQGDERAISVLSKVDLWLIPTLNPDGFALRKRGNSNGVDLNRDFPDRFNEGACSNWLPRSGKEQKETQVLMDWMLERGPFVSSLAIHEGALVANYPWDGSKDKSSTYQASPDDETFKYLASHYASYHRKMSLPSNKEFPKGGITNGANWYPIYGSMQDWNYIVGSCMELTLEVSEGKWPQESTLPSLFEDNRESMLDFIMRTSHGGFTGIVYGIHSTGRKTGKENIPIAASIKVEESFLNTTTDPNTGKFYRPLAPGKYLVEVTANGFKPKQIQIVIGEGSDGIFEGIYLNQKQQKSDSKMSAKISLENVSEIQAGIIILSATCGLTLGMLWWIHLSLISRQSSGSLMKILKK
jgi:carboxypeptidase D